MDRMKADDLINQAIQLGRAKDHWIGVTSALKELPSNIVIYHQKFVGHWFKKNLFNSKYVLSINLDGPSSVGIEHQEYSFDYMTAFLIFPYQYHYYITPKDEVHWIIFIFDLPQDAQLNLNRNLIVSLEEQVLSFISEILSSYSKALGASTQAENELTLQLSLLLSRLFTQNNPSPSTTLKKSKFELMNRIGHYLDLNSGKKVTVDTLANEFLMSASNLRKRFRESIGVSLGEYLIQYRMKQACSMLVMGKASISEIAYQCGFGSPEAMSHAFKHRHGIAPGEYRRQYRLK